MKHLVISIMVLLGFSGALSAQSVIKIHGLVVHGSKPLPQVNVYDQSSHAGTITNYKGAFEIVANIGDTLSFSSIGYKPSEYILPDTLTASSYRLLVNMVPDTVLLRETVVMPWPSKNMLKQAFLEHTKEKDPISVYAGFRTIEGDPKAPEPTIFNPFSLLSDKVGKKARHKRKMRKYKKALDDDLFFFDEED